MLAQIPYPPKWTSFTAKSPLIVCVISVECTRKTWSMPCIAAQCWVPYRVKLQYGIMKHSRAIGISLTLWVLFLQVIRNRSYSLIIWNLWNHHNNLRRGKAALPLDKIIEHARERQLEAFAPLAIPSLHRGQHQMG